MGDDDQMKNIRFRDGKMFGDWEITKKIDEGGFGQVYMVTNIKTKKRAALKAESNEIDGGPAIKLEINILKELNKAGPKAHIPEYFHAAKRGKFSYMIMTLLGNNLKQLKVQNEVLKDRFTKGTWARVGIQCLYSIKFLHDNGFIHRDIKPNNFVLGSPMDPERCRMIHVLDFGLARQYAFQKGGRWKMRRARGTAELRGTLRYCSPNVHLKKEQGRQDDLWSLFYLLIEFNGGLPWQKENDRQKIEVMKVMMKDEDVSMNMPPCTQKVCPELRKLNCYERPDYFSFYDVLKTVLKKEKVTWQTKYDWETTEEADAAKKTKPPDWENGDEFFKSDPVKLFGPPEGGGVGERTQNSAQMMI